MATVEDVALAHHQRRQTLIAETAAAADAAWRRIDPDDIAATWAAQVPELTAAVTVAQRAAVVAADQYVDTALAAQGTATATNGAVSASLAGVASDGRRLDTLVANPAFTALRAIAGGVATPEALTIGHAALARIVVTQVADIGKIADGLAVTARRRTGFVRMLTPPSCSRCAVLAGRPYRWNEGFLRHPRCDCVHIPAAEAIAGDLTTDSDAYFASLTETEQNRIFTSGGAQAIRDGADIGQVVNARRGMTPVGTTFERSRTGARLMPQTIYDQAAGDRARAIELLRRHGYLI